MGCGCGGARRPMVGTLVNRDANSVAVTAASVTTWRITYPDGTTEDTPSLLAARRKARAGQGRVSTA